MLTRSEQRVVILAVVALFGAASVHYWRETNSRSAPDKIEQDLATPTPFPEEDVPDSETQE